MSNGDELLLLKNKLEKALDDTSVDSDMVTDLLNRIQTIPMTVALLTNTKVGIVVNKSRKVCTRDDVQKITKQLLTTWKSLALKPASSSSVTAKRTDVETKRAEIEERELSSPTDPTSPPAPVETKPVVKEEKNSKPTATTKEGKSPQKSNSNSRVSIPGPSSLQRKESGFGAFLELGGLQDDTRNKVQKSLFGALGDEPASGPLSPSGGPSAAPPTPTPSPVNGPIDANAGAPSPTDISPPMLIVTRGPGRTEIAVRMEAAMFSKFGTSQDYRNKFRSLAYNLKDIKNKLAARLYAGEMDPEYVVELSESELASKDVQEKRLKEKQYMKDAARSDWQAMLGATDIFQCERCGKKKCKYFQMQTRGADEPMTVFVTCLECGHKWRSGDNE